MADMNKQVAPVDGRDDAKLVQSAEELERVLEDLER